MGTLSREEVVSWPAPDRAEARSGAALREALARHGLLSPAQVAGRNWPVGCVSLEITQRCNLDCTLCYLSDISEAVHDLPLAEVFRRIDMIADHYGPGTNVQISGGDPTLRRRDELVAITRRIARRGMTPALFTNGIKASRDLLAALRKAGLCDVAFHVDLTQERKGYKSETALNTLREDYIARAKGLGLRIMFNTTVFDGNWAEMEGLARFFIAHAREVNLASFQLQAETGRGVLGARGEGVTQEGMMAALERAAGCRLDFDMPLVGHPHCNRYTGLWVAGGRAHPVFDDAALFADLFAASADTQGLWRRRRTAAAIAATLCRHPFVIPRLLVYAARKLWRMRRDLKCGRPSKLSFFIHNFMDAEGVDRARCESCVFMAAGRDGPVSMCVYNARREGEITAPIAAGDRQWNPLNGAYGADGTITADDLPVKRLKGRLRAAAYAARR